MTTVFRTVVIKRATKPHTDLPKFWRPKVNTTQQVDCQVIHWDLITRFTDGSADVGDLWDWIETGMTYQKMAELLQADGVQLTPEALDALASQLGTYTSIIDRYRRTRRVAFSAQEYLIAKAAACVMDGLITLDRNGIAFQAGTWAIAQMTTLRASLLADPAFAPTTSHTPTTQPTTGEPRHAA